MLIDWEKKSITTLAAAAAALAAASSAAAALAIARTLARDGATTLPTTTNPLVLGESTMLNELITIIIKLPPWK